MSSEKKTTYCLTGATGFLGEHLIRVLLQKKDVNIRLLTRKSGAAYQAEPRITIIQGDLLNKQSLNDFLISGAVLINLAYLHTGSEDNLLAARNLAAICREQSASRLLHVSSAVVAGRQSQDWITEENIPYPINDYEKNKLDIEKIFSQDLNGQIPLVILRPTAIFGLGGKNGLKIIDDFQRESHFIRRLKLTLLGDQQLHLVAVENVVAAITFLLSQPTLSGSFIISDDDSNNNNYSFFIEILSKAMALPAIMPYPLLLIRKILPFLLKLRGRTQFNPNQRYACFRLKQAGFNQSIKFEAALENYLENSLRGK